MLVVAIALFLCHAHALIGQSKHMVPYADEIEGKRCSHTSCPSIETYPETCTASQLCDLFALNSRRPNSQHCYLFTNTALVCGFHDRRDGLYLMPSGPDSRSKDTCEVSGGPYEIHCPAILSYLGQSEDSQETHGHQLEL